MPPTTPATPAPAPAPALLDELLEEVFLRLPPDEPEHIVRASLVSKLWLGLLSSPRFRGRYRDFHGAPPMLGFFCSEEEESVPCPHFVSTTKCGDICSVEFDKAVWDCRHGRVLLGEKDRELEADDFVVWIPMAAFCREYGLGPLEASWDADSRGAAVLCDVPGCDHRACHHGPCLLVYVYALQEGEDDFVAYVAVEEDTLHGRMGSCPGLHLASYARIEPMPSVLIQDTLHFMLTYHEDHRVGLLKYDFSSNCLSLIDAPLAESVGSAIFMAMEDGTLGFAHANMLTLHLWSRHTGSDGVAAWTQRRVIDLVEVLPIQNPEEKLRLVGSVEGSDIIYVATDLGIYEIKLKTLRWKKLWKSEKFRALFPYMSFYDPRGISI